MKMSRQFDQELTISNRICCRWRVIETAVSKSILSVTTRNSDLARDVIIEDITLNRMELAIEEQAFKLLALRQPLASDLRLTTATMRIATELERIGDQAVNIAERALELNSSPPLQLPIDLKVMSDIPGHGEYQHRRLRAPGSQAGHQGVSAGCGSGSAGR
jgi:phosphate transport system protein